MKKYCLGNWKMNQSLDEVKSFCKEFQHESNELYVGVAPQAVHIPYLIDNCSMNIGSQNCSEHIKGAFTGELGPSFLKELGVSFSLIGHSERRSLFKETTHTCIKKIENAHLNDLLAVYCIGETLQEFEAAKTKDVLKTQLLPLLDNDFSNNKEKIVIAYEPVWAIGTGKVPTLEIISEVTSFIHETCLQHKQDYSVLYGGSVKPTNVKDISQIDTVQGVLVGGASLKADSFMSLCSAF